MPNASRCTSIKLIYLRLLFCMLLGMSAPINAAVISVGTIPPLPVAPPIAIPAGTFLVPVQISGAVNLQNWQFDLFFNDQVVQVVLALSPSGIPGIFEAEFTPGDASSLSDIQSGFPFFAGLVDDVAGAHPGLLSGPSGNGVLAYVLFEFLPGQETNNPGFRIGDSVVQQQDVPEPGTLALFATALLMVAFARRRLGRVRLSNAR